MVEDLTKHILRTPLPLPPLHPSRHLADCFCLYLDEACEIFRSLRECLREATNTSGTDLTDALEADVQTRPVKQERVFSAKSNLTCFISYKCVLF